MFAQTQKIKKNATIKDSATTKKINHMKRRDAKRNKRNLWISTGE